MTVVTPNSITVEGRGGLSLELQFKAADGSARDVSTNAIFFEVENILRVALLAGSTASMRVISLDRDHVALIGIKTRNFVCVDETGSVQDAFWAGIIKVKGFTGQPT